jgi:hypothetical protein
MHKFASPHFHPLPPPHSQKRDFKKSIKKFTREKKLKKRR